MVLTPTFALVPVNPYPFVPSPTCFTPAASCLAGEHQDRSVDGVSVPVHLSPELVYGHRLPDLSGLGVMGVAEFMLGLDDLPGRFYVDRWWRGAVKNEGAKDQPSPTTDTLPATFQIQEDTGARHASALTAHVAGYGGLDQVGDLLT